MKLSLFQKIFFIAVATLLLNACASTSRVVTEHPATAYVAKEADDLLARHAPIIVPQNQYKTYNKMGRPSARYDARGKEEQIYVDPAAPVFYTQHGTIRMHQEREYPGRVSATELRNPDFAALARAYGGHGETVKRTEEFAGALKRSRASGKPAIIHCLIDPEAITPARSLSEIREAALKK